MIFSIVSTIGDEDMVVVIANTLHKNKEDTKRGQGARPPGPDQRAGQETTRCI